MTTTDRRIVFVVGPGRSGTSTMAGSLAHLGFHVPQPEVAADESNPRGFYEPRWVVDFHKSLLNPVPVRTMEARPEAFGLVQEAIADGRPAARLTEWLTGHLHLRRLCRLLWGMTRSRHRGRRPRSLRPSRVVLLRVPGPRPSLYPSRSRNNNRLRTTARLRRAPLL